MSGSPFAGLERGSPWMETCVSLCSAFTSDRTLLVLVSSSYSRNSVISIYLASPLFSHCALVFRHVPQISTDCAPAAYTFQIKIPYRSWQPQCRYTSLNPYTSRHFVSERPLYSTTGCNRPLGLSNFASNHTQIGAPIVHHYYSQNVSLHCPNYVISSQTYDLYANNAREGDEANETKQG